MSSRNRVDLPPIVRPQSAARSGVPIHGRTVSPSPPPPPQSSLFPSESSYTTGEYLVPTARMSSTTSMHTGSRRGRTGRSGISSKSRANLASRSNPALTHVVQERQRQVEEHRRSKNASARTAIVREMAASDDLLQRVLLDDSHLPFIHDHESDDAEEMLSLIMEEGKLLDKCAAELGKRVAPTSATDAHYITRLRKRYSTLFRQIPKAASLLHEENALITAINTHLTQAFHNFYSEVASARGKVEACKKRLQNIQSPHETKEHDQPTDYTQTPADLKHELHDLYELQRSRLIREMEKLRGERDNWCQAAFQLASAVAEKKHFETMRRLQLHQTTWNTSAQRFCGRLTADCDEVVMNVKDNMQAWKRLVSIMQRKLLDDESELKKAFKEINSGMESMITAVDNARENKTDKSIVWKLGNKLFTHWRSKLSEILDDTVTSRSEDFQSREKECASLLQELTAEAMILFKCHKRLESKNMIKLRSLNEEVSSFFQEIGDRLSVTSDFVGNMMTLRDGAEDLHEKIQETNPPSLDFIRGKLVAWHVLVGMLIDFVSHAYNIRTMVSSAEEWELSLAMDTAAQCAQLTDQVGDTTRKVTAWFVNVQKLACGINEMTIVSLSDEGEEAISSLAHTTTTVTNACTPMASLHEGAYKELSSITYEMEEWKRRCHGILADFRGSKSEGIDLAQVFARNKEVKEVTEEWDTDEGYKIASVDGAGNIVIHDVPTYKEMKEES